MFFLYFYSPRFPHSAFPTLLIFYTVHCAFSIEPSKRGGARSYLTRQRLVTEPSDYHARMSNDLNKL